MNIRKIIREESVFEVNEVFGNFYIADTVRDEVWGMCSQYERAEAIAFALNEANKELSK